MIDQLGVGNSISEGVYADFMYDLELFVKSGHIFLTALFLYPTLPLYIIAKCFTYKSYMVRCYVQLHYLVVNEKLFYR